jgi:hypothetical protein
MRAMEPVSRGWEINQSFEQKQGGRMKTLYKFKMLLAALIICSTASLTSAMAGALDTHDAVEVNIPFTFNANNTRLPAGDYELASASFFDPSLELHNSNDTVGVFLLAEEVDNATHPNTPELIFDKIGGKEFLREVRTENTDFWITKSLQERRMEMQGNKAVSHKIAATHKMKRS